MTKESFKKAFFISVRSSAFHSKSLLGVEEEEETEESSLEDEGRELSSFEIEELADIEDESPQEARPRRRIKENTDKIDFFIVYPFNFYLLSLANLIR